jgi:hypothetical protein
MRIEHFFNTLKKKGLSQLVSILNLYMLSNLTQMSNLKTQIFHPQSVKPTKLRSSCSIRI